MDGLETDWWAQLRAIAKARDAHIRRGLKIAGPSWGAGEIGTDGIARLIPDPLEGKS